MDLLFGDLGKELIILIQTFLSPLLDIPFLIVSFMGDELVFIILIGGIYWIFSKKEGIKLLYYMGLTGFLNTFLKGVFGTLRPYQVYPNEISAISTASGYSFPSGHAMSSTVFYTYGMNKFKTNNLLVFLLSILILVIAFSRIYLGVHYLSDVLIGILVGLIILHILIKISPWVENLLVDMPSFTIISLGFLVSFVLLMISTVSTITFGNELDIAPNGEFPGVIAGATLGLVLEKRFIGFNTDNLKTGTKFMRLFFGYFIVLNIYILINVAFSQIQDEMKVLTDYLSFFLLSFSAAFIVPYVFSKFERIPSN